MSYSGQNSIGFVSAGMQIVTAADIAVESGIEERVIREKFGIIVATHVGYVWGTVCVRWGPTEA